MECILTLDGPHSPACFSPDKNICAVGGRYGSVKLWNCSTAKFMGCVLEGHSDLVWSMVYSADGSQLITASKDKTIRVWDIARDGSATCKYKLAEHTNEVLDVAISPNGRLVASASVDGTIRIWDLNDASCAARVDAGKPVNCVAFSPDGKYVAAGTAHGKILLVTVANGDCATYKNSSFNQWAVHSVCFSPDSRLLATGSGPVESKDRGEASIFELSDAPDVSIMKKVYKDWVTSVQFSPSGRTLCVANSVDVIMINVETQDEVKLDPHNGHKERVLTVAFSKDGLLLTSGTESVVKIWQAKALSASNTLVMHVTPRDQVQRVSARKSAEESFDASARNAEKSASFKQREAEFRAQLESDRAKFRAGKTGTSSPPRIVSPAREGRGRTLSPLKSPARGSSVTRETGKSPF